MYAIVKTGGKQYTVKPGDVFDVEKIPGEAGDKVELEVLLLNDGKQVVTDTAALAGKVVAQIIDQHKGEKQLVFKFKKRKGYKRTKGHRQQLTKIGIVEVDGEAGDISKPKFAKAEKAETVAAEAPEAEVVEEAAKPAPVEEEAPKAEAPKAEEAPAAEPEAIEEKQDFSKMTVAQLKEFAKEHDIKIASGARKAEIIETIEQAL